MQLVLSPCYRSEYSGFPKENILPQRVPHKDSIELAKGNDKIKVTFNATSFMNFQSFFFIILLQFYF